MVCNIAAFFTWVKLPYSIMFFMIHSVVKTIPFTLIPRDLSLGIL
jgi:hypothetical protein